MSQNRYETCHTTQVFKSALCQGFCWWFTFWSLLYHLIHTDIPIQNELFPKIMPAEMPTKILYVLSGVCWLTRSLLVGRRQWWGTESMWLCAAFFNNWCNNSCLWVWSKGGAVIDRCLVSSSNAVREALMNAYFFQYLIVIVLWSQFATLGHPLKKGGLNGKHPSSSLELERNFLRDVWRASDIWDGLTSCCWSNSQVTLNHLSTTCLPNGVK